MLLALALIPILDCIIIIFLAQLLGTFLFLAIIVFLSLAGFFFSLRLTFRTQKQIKDNLRNNILSLKHYNSLPGTLVIAYLLIVPGIISTIIGLIFAIPHLRSLLGSKISLYLKIDWKEIHEYMNIID